MAVTYANITSATSTRLIEKGSTVSGSIDKILIANHPDSSSTVINLYLDDGTNEYVIVETKIPARTTLVLEDNVRFDSSVYHLSITTSSAGYAITVIIK